MIAYTYPQRALTPLPHLNSTSLLMVFILISSAFADTMYLKNGQEIKDATITEIGISEVKYKIDEREVLYIVKKSDIAIILYADGTNYVFDSDKEARKNDDDNFTKGQRWGTWGINTLIPGLGSAAFMDDWVGVLVQWGLIGTGVAIGFLIEGEKSGYSGGIHPGDYVLFGSLVGVGVSYIWNIYRSIAYKKPVPKTTSLADPSNFDFAVQPNRNGNGMNYGLRYNVRF